MHDDEKQKEHLVPALLHWRRAPRRITDESIWSIGRGPVSASWLTLPCRRLIKEQWQQDGIRSMYFQWGTNKNGCHWLLFATHRSSGPSHTGPTNSIVSSLTWVLKRHLDRGTMPTCPVGGHMSWSLNALRSPGRNYQQTVSSVWSAPAVLFMFVKSTSWEVRTCWGAGPRSINLRNMGPMEDLNLGQDPKKRRPCLIWKKNVRFASSYVFACKSARGHDQARVILIL